MIGFDDLDIIQGKGDITTFDINNTECNFLYRYGNVRNDIYDLEGICFQVYTSFNSPLLSFEAHLIEYEDGFKVVMINHNDIEVYIKKGIPEYLIPKIAEIYNKNIYSSSTIKEFKSYDDESRVPNATKFWERIRNNFPYNVIKNSDGDFYKYSNSIISDLDKKVEVEC